MSTIALVCMGFNSQFIDSVSLADEQIMILNRCIFWDLASVHFLKLEIIHFFSPRCVIDAVAVDSLLAIEGFVSFERTGGVAVKGHAPFHWKLMHFVQSFSGFTLKSTRLTGMAF